MKLCRLLAFSMLCYYVSSIFIYKSLKPQQQFCLNDDIPKHTLVKVDLKSEGDIKFEFKQGLFVVFSMAVDKMAFTRAFTTQRYGNHNFCFFNKDTHQSRIGFQISIGKDAGDFGSAVQGDDLMSALQSQANLAELFIHEIVQETTEGLQIMVHEAAQSHPGYYMMFSVAFGLAAMFLTFLQYKVIKKHLHNRKYI